MMAQSAQAAGAIALLSAVGDPEGSKKAIERIEAAEASMRETTNNAHAEVAKLQALQKEVAMGQRALEAAKASQEEDVAKGQAALSTKEINFKKREDTLDAARAVLRQEQQTHKITSRVQEDRLKNLEISLSGREKNLKRLEGAIEEQQRQAREAMAAAEALKAEYEAKAAKLSQLLSA